MGSPSKRKQHSGTVCGFSGSGNPIVKKSEWDMRVVVVIKDADSAKKGDTIRFTIQAEHHDHYEAALVGQGKSNISKPDYSSSANIPIHHDGKHGESVGDTRNRRETFETPEEREFDPQTEGAPRLSKDKPKRTNLRQE